ncbi:MAG: hypothetical protein AAGC46_12750 [Solirubrobacteraceae bacterium]|nr:hypothetical protein [Patulibacter sp.]
MASSTTPASARRARVARRNAGTPRWDGQAAFDGRPIGAQPSRGRRLLTRTGPLALLLICLPFLVSLIKGPGFMTPAQVSAKAHDEVLRQVIARTGDYSTTIGRLDCVQIEPGKGNCLADYRTQSHQTDGLMVAAAYDLQRGSNDLNLVIKLP